MSDMAIEYRQRPISVADYHRMDDAGIFGDDERLELVDGELIVVPRMGPRHGGWIAELNRLFTLRFNDRALVRIQLPLPSGTYSEPEPDLALVPFATHRWIDRHPSAADALLVLEVADTSRSFDLHRKAPMYGRAGVRETWVLDVVERRLVVHREPSANGYAVTQILRDGDRVAPVAFPADVFTVAELLIG